MKISAMNVKIIFQENRTTIDKIGNHTNEWRDYYICHATVTGESGTEEFTAGEIVENIDIAFTVRYCKKVAVITSTNFRIIFNNELWCITDCRPRILNFTPTVKIPKPRQLLKVFSITTAFFTTNPRSGYLRKNSTR